MDDIKAVHTVGRGSQALSIFSKKERVSVINKLASSLVLASALVWGTGGAVSSPSLSVQAHSESNYSSWVYQVTETYDNEYYGTNNQYEDFPHVYFTSEELKAGQKIKEGDWVVTVFNHDDIIQIIKIK